MARYESAPRDAENARASWASGPKAYSLSRPQRFHGPALLLTLAPAALIGVIFLGWVFIVAMFAAGWN